MPKISVCIPIYNVEKYIGRCLDSILSQSFNDIEILLVNDCATDQSISIARQYSKEDSRIKIFEHEENAGQMYARYTAYMRASGEYLVFCDGDDWLPSRALEELFNAIESNKSDIVIGNLEICSAVDKVIRVQSNQNKYGVDKESTLKALLKGTLSHSMCGRIFKRSLFQDNDFEIYKNFTNSEDAYLFYQLVTKSSSIVCIDSITYSYYLNPNSISRTRLSEKSLECMAIAANKIMSIVADYPSIGYLLDKYISNYVICWMLAGNKSYKETYTVLKRNGLSHYLSIRSCFSGLTPDFHLMKTYLRYRCR